MKCLLILLWPCLFAQQISTPSSPAYGEITSQANAVSTTLTTQNTWYQVTGIWNLPGHCNGVTCNASSLTVLYSGGYLLNVTGSINMTANHQFELGLFVNGVLSPDSSPVISHGVSTQATFAWSGYHSYAVNDVVDLRVRCTDASGQAITIASGNLNIGIAR